jgi:hypothetical protein
MFRIVFVSMIALTAWASSARAEPVISKNVIEAALKAADCSATYEEATARLDPPHELGEGQQLQEVLCWRAAYQYAGIFFAYDSASPGNARLLSFRFPQARGYESRSSVTSPEVDDKEKTLTSFHKGRGPGDCGSAGEWKWNGRDFLLQRYWLKVDCNGKRFDPKRRPAEWLIFPKK